MLPFVVLMLSLMLELRKFWRRASSSSSLRRASVRLGMVRRVREAVSPMFRRHTINKPPRLHLPDCLSHSQIFQ